MPLYALKPNAIRRYVPKACRQDPQETQTTFWLRSLSADLVARMLDFHQETIQTDSDGKVISVKSPRDTRNLDILRLCLAGWENFATEDGETVEFTAVEENVFGARNVPRATIEAVSMIPTHVRAEIAEACWSSTQVSEADAKN